MKNILETKNLSKKYKRYPNQWSRFAEWLTAGRYRTHEERWALRGVSFEVDSGEAVGIIGQNGAGKSTLLKILTRTTKPSKGNIKIGGRVSALLELGMGFHPNFTGRENAVMACRMAGLNREQIEQLLPAIASFSELGDYLDQPMRVYSTGMQMRLAFSASTVVRPEILILDEVLAVGDAYFSHKCVNRIRTFKEQGTTLLFVSHDPGSVKALCDRAILIDKGILIRDGSPDAVLDYYNAMISVKRKNEEIWQVESEFGATVTRSGDGRAYFENVEMLDENDRPARAFRVGDTAKIRCDVISNASLESPTVGILIRDRLGNDVFGTNSFHLEVDKEIYRAGENIEATFTLPLNLGCGNYSLCVAIHSGDTHLQDNYDWWDQCLAFQVIPGNSFSFIGLASLPVELKMQRKHKK